LEKIVVKGGQDHAQRIIAEALVAIVAELHNLKRR